MKKDHELSTVDWELMMVRLHGKAWRSKVKNHKCDTYHNKNNVCRFCGRGS